jgi:hypothetical protein
LPEVLQRFVPLPQIVVDRADIGQGDGQAAPVAHFFSNGQGLPVVLQRLVPLPQSVVDQADIGQQGCFIPLQALPAPAKALARAWSRVVST